VSHLPELRWLRGERGGFFPLSSCEIPVTLVIGHLTGLNQGDTDGRSPVRYVPQGADGCQISPRRGGGAGWRPGRPHRSRCVPGQTQKEEKEEGRLASGLPTLATGWVPRELSRLSAVRRWADLYAAAKWHRLRQQRVHQLPERRLRAPAEQHQLQCRA